MNLRFSTGSYLYGDSRLPDRFWAKVAVEESGCWPWIAYRTEKGYGKVCYQRKAVRAHRLAYEVLVGPIEAGLEIDHLCGNRACCNPAHLEAITHKENLLRGDTTSARHAAATHCPQGHEYRGANLGFTKRGRFCRTCKRDWDRRYHARVA